MDRTSVDAHEAPERRDDKHRDTVASLHEGELMCLKARHTGSCFFKGHDQLSTDAAKPDDRELQLTWPS